MAGAGFGDMDLEFTMAGVALLTCIQLSWRAQDLMTWTLNFQ